MSVTQYTAARARLGDLLGKHSDECLPVVMEAAADEIESLRRELMLATLRHELKLATEHWSKLTEEVSNGR